MAYKSPHILALDSLNITPFSQKGIAAFMIHGLYVIAILSKKLMQLSLAKCFPSINLLQGTRSSLRVVASRYAVDRSLAQLL